MLLNFRLYFYEHIFLPLWFAFKQAKKKKKTKKKLIETAKMIPKSEHLKEYKLQLD